MVYTEDEGLHCLLLEGGQVNCTVSHLLDAQTKEPETPPIRDLRAQAQHVFGVVSSISLEIVQGNCLDSLSFEPGDSVVFKSYTGPASTYHLWKMNISSQTPVSLAALNTVAAAYYNASAATAVNGSSPPSRFTIENILAPRPYPIHPTRHSPYYPINPHPHFPVLPQEYYLGKLTKSLQSAVLTTLNFKLVHFVGFLIHFVG